MAVITTNNLRQETGWRDNREAWPQLNRNQKRGGSARHDQSKVVEIDYLTTQEKEKERKYLEQMATGTSPWTAKARTFLDVQETSSPDLSLAHIPSLNPSTMLIKLDATDQLPVLDGWGMCLAGIFMGRFPGKEAVLTLMQRWPSKATVTFHSKGWMFFQFPSLQGLRATLEKGPFSIFGIPLHMVPVDDGFSFTKKLEKEIPVWIRLPDLPPLLWTKAVIEKIASTVGVPIAVDEATIRKEVLDGPRVQVRVNATRKPRDIIDIMTANGHLHTQRIIYETQPKFCEKCSVFGHFGADCLGPQTRGRQPAKQFGAGGNRMLSREGRGGMPRPDGRPPSRPPPKGQNPRRHSRDRSNPAARPHPNRFDPLGEENNEGNKGKEVKTMHGVETIGAQECQEESSSFHSSDTAMRPFFEPQNLNAEPSVDGPAKEETVVDNWEVHENPTSPLRAKGNSDTTLPSCSTDAASFVSERVKESCNPETTETHAEEQAQDATPPSLPVREKIAAAKPSLSQEEVADQAIKKIIHASNAKKNKHGHSPSNKKKKRKGHSASKHH